MRSRYAAGCVQALVGLGVLASALMTAERSSATVTSSTVFISQFHYDDDGTDSGECIEISGTAGTDLSGYSLVRYNGNGGAVYTTPVGPTVTGIIPNEAGTGYGALFFTYPVDGLQNGAPDAIALVQGSTCIELLSYEGSFSAVGGACGGSVSTNIGVSETDDDVGSLKRTGAGTHNLDLTWTGPTAGNCDGLLNFTVGAATATDLDIPEIQGADVSFESLSPAQGDLVRTTGVVTAVFQVEGMGGFYIQDPLGDGDSNTSDGIFVVNTSTPVQVGQTVRVTGNVEEREAGFTIAVIDQVPAPTTVLGDHPGSETAILASLVEVIDPGSSPLAPTELHLPIVGPLNDGELERYEGMYVRITTDASSDQMRIAQTYFLGRYGQMTLAAPAQGSGLLTPLVQPTGAFAPSATPGESAYESWLDQQRRMLILDDGMDLLAGGDNPEPSPYNDDCTRVVRAGDLAGNLIGILDWGRINSGPASDFNSDYRLQPVVPEDIVITSANPRPAPPATAGPVVVATVNLLNYFTNFQSGAPSGSDFRGAFTALEFKRQTDKLVEAICALDADIVGVVEVQNPVSGDFDLPLKTLVDGGTFGTTLVNGLNDKPGCGPFTAILTGRNGTDAIKNGLIYKPAEVTPVNTPVVGVGDDLGDALLVTDGLAQQQSRPTLVQRFSKGSASFTVAVSHFKSKRPSCGNDEGNQAGDCDPQRTAFAQNRLLPTLQAIGGDVLSIGDFNAYAEEAPIAVFENAGWLDMIGDAEGLLAQDFIFDGAVGTLTHAFASPSLRPKVLAAEGWRINSDEPQMLEYATPPWYVPTACYQPNAFRSSDHDPYRIVLGIGAPAVPAFGPVGFGIASLGLLFAGGWVARRRTPRERPAD